MANENIDLLTTAVPTSNNTEFEILDTGAYDAICVGVTARNFKKYQSEDLETKFQFIFQVVDNNQKHYLRTLPYRNVINEKSNLFLFLSNWTGATLDKLAQGLDLKKLVGLKAQVVVGDQEREGKKYNTITSVIKAKKNSTVTFIQDEHAPAYLTKDLLAAKWMDGLSFAEAKPQEEDAKITDADLIKAAEASKDVDMDADLPF